MSQALGVSSERAPATGAGRCETVFSASRRHFHATRRAARMLQRATHACRLRARPPCDRWSGRLCSLTGSRCRVADPRRPSSWLLREARDCALGAGLPYVCVSAGLVYRGAGMVDGKMDLYGTPGGLYLSFTRTVVPNGWPLPRKEFQAPLGETQGSVFCPWKFQHVDSWSRGFEPPTPQIV